MNYIVTEPGLTDMLDGMYLNQKNYELAYDMWGEAFEVKEYKGTISKKTNWFNAMALQSRLNAYEKAEKTGLYSYCYKVSEFVSAN